MKDSISKKSGIEILRFETGRRAYNEYEIISKIREKIIEYTKREEV